MGVLSTRWRTLLVVAAAAERLVELRISAQNRARRGPSAQAAPRTYPVMVCVHVALYAVCVWPRRGRRVPTWVELTALLGLATATALRLWVIRTLGPEWNVTAHVHRGASVVTSGPYRRLRHPNYAAVMLEFVGLPLAVGAVPEAAVLSAANAAVLIPRVRAEEALLAELPGYRAAFEGVPRFIPLPGRRSVHIPSSAR